MGILIVDYAISVYFGRYGFTVGPLFLTLDKDGDIARFYGKPLNVMSRFTWEWHRPALQCGRCGEQQGSDHTCLSDYTF